MVNGKQYVGQTTRTLEQRWREHCSQHTSIVDKVIARYGKDNFSIEIIDTAVDLNELNQKEIYWIQKYNSKIPNGYNVAAGGSGVPVVKTQEWKQKIGESNRGNKREDLSKYNKLYKSKKVMQLSLTGDLITIWNSSREIENAGIGNHSLINRICNGDPKRHTAYGYKWKYYESEVV